MPTLFGINIECMFAVYLLKVHGNFLRFIFHVPDVWRPRTTRPAHLAYPTPNVPAIHSASKNARAQPTIATPSNQSTDAWFDPGQTRVKSSTSTGRHPVLTWFSPFFKMTSRKSPHPARLRQKSWRVKAGRAILLSVVKFEH